MKTYSIMSALVESEERERMREVFPKCAEYEDYYLFPTTLKEQFDIDYAGTVDISNWILVDTEEETYENWEWIEYTKTKEYFKTFIFNMMNADHTAAELVINREQALIVQEEYFAVDETLED